MRKQLVFPIMYGYYADASKLEAATWRSLAADFINGKRDNVPLTLHDLRGLMDKDRVRRVDPGPACHGRAYDDACPGCVSYWQD